MSDREVRAYVSETGKMCERGEGKGGICTVH